MPPAAAATTLRGALLTLGQGEDERLERVDRRLGDVLTGTDPSRSMHGVFGWLDPGGSVPEDVALMRRRAVGELAAAPRGRTRIELVSAVHTATLALTFFHRVNAVLTREPELRPPAARDWHQEDHSFVSYLYGDDVPLPSATQAFEAHLTGIARWVADRAERVHRALHRANPSSGTEALLEHEFAHLTTLEYASAFSALSREVPELAVWANAVDADNGDRAREWLSSTWNRTSADTPLHRLTSANLAVLHQPLAGEPHLPGIDRLYVSPDFRPAEAGPSARLTDGNWWAAETTVRRDLTLTLAGHLSSPQAARAPMLVIGDAGAGKSATTRMLAAVPLTGELAVVRVPLGQADPRLSVADQVEQALRYLTSDRVTWDDLAGHETLVLLDGLDELLAADPNIHYLSEVVRFQQTEAARDRPVAVVVTSRTSSVGKVLIPDGVPVVRLEPFDEAQTRAWVGQWNQATADTPRRELRLETVLAHESLAHQPLLLFLMARYLTDPSVPEPPADLSTSALLERLNDLRAQRLGMEPQALAVAALGMFNRGREWLSEAEFHADLTALNHRIPQAWGHPLRSGPLTDYQIASFLLEVLTEPADELLFALLSHRPLWGRPPVQAMLTRLAGDMTPARRRGLAHTVDRMIHGLGRLRGAGRYVAYLPVTPDQDAVVFYTTNLTLLKESVSPGGAGPGDDPPATGVEFVHRSLALGDKPIGQVTWSSDGRLLTTVSGGRMSFWDIAGNGRAVASHPRVSDVAWHPARPLAAIVRRKDGSGETDTHDVVLIGFDGQEERHLLPARRGSRISWSPDGSALALIDPVELRIVDAASGRTREVSRLREFPQQPNLYVPKPRWTRDGRHVLAVHRREVRMVGAADLTTAWAAYLAGDTVETFVDRTCAIAVVSFPGDAGIRIHDLPSGKAIALLQEHTAPVVCARFSPEGEFLASMSTDNTVRIWRCRDWQCVATLEREVVERRGGLAFHPTEPLLAIKDGGGVDVVRLDHRVLNGIGPAGTARRYANAKVVLVGDTGVGKSGLGLVLSGQPFAPTESTHGRNVWTFEKSYATQASGEVQTRETLLWDLAGQPGYRMVHQLHLNEVAVALVVFDARSETDPFAGVQYWSRALTQARRLDGSAALPMRVLLVAARADRGTAAVSQDRIRETMQAFGFEGYVETSAKEGWGVDDLVRAVRDGIDWDALPVVSSNELFEAIKDFVVEEKQQGRILSTVDDLMRSFRRTQREAPPLDELADRFSACIGQLESVGVVRRMSYGDYVLLRPELLDSYASSLVQAAKDEPDGLGFVKEDDALAGNFRIPQDERLTDPQQERILLNAVVQELLRREIALKEVTDREVDLIFPSQFTRERPDAPRLPGQDVVFTFDGHLYSIYSTLAVRLSHSRFFEKHEMWHNSATYKADAGLMCGIAIREVEEGKGELALFFDEHVEPLVRKQFEAYAVEHLELRAGDVMTRRVRRCGLCRYTIPEDLVRGRIGRGKTKMTCPQCDDFVITLTDGPDVVGDVRPVVAEMNSNANAQRDQDVAATTLRGKREAGDFDVFLCHNVLDKPQVLEIVTELEARGILPWLDIRDIQPGSRWQREMARGIEMSRSAAVLIGPSGPGPWHEAEMELINDWSARNRGRRVIPVILEGTQEDPDLPGFLRVWSTVDMRTADPDPIEQLIWGITGQHPRWA
ncbi:TIR domain-containing protein [Lentzea sp.]|uniref:NACHT N-terminal helical domain 7-containing protein n=1 Tax=Lentzea sp. TaxID=56099 RepID=UPI002D01E83F|nr:TIR domain-containing protein [Lentzea sp.]HUQ55351.1 TIR domain-containing protein [Lentzea sp.]